MAILRKPNTIERIQSNDENQNEALAKALQAIELAIQAYNITPHDQLEKRADILNTLITLIKKLKFPPEISAEKALYEVKEMLRGDDDSHPEFKF